MRVRFVIADLIRNPRRTIWTTIGVMLGVGFFCAVLFFIDGLSASMTQRAAAPLAIDIQRVISEPVAADLRLRLSVDPEVPAVPGDSVTVVLELTNSGATPANEVVVRSAPQAGLRFMPGSALVDGVAVQAADNPFASGLAQTGLNIGTVPPGGVGQHELRGHCGNRRHHLCRQFHRHVFHPRGGHADCRQCRCPGRSARPCGADQGD